MALPKPFGPDIADSIAAATLAAMSGVFPAAGAAAAACFSLCAAISPANIFSAP